MNFGGSLAPFNHKRKETLETYFSFKNNFSWNKKIEKTAKELISYIQKSNSLISYGAEFKNLKNLEIWAAKIY